VDWWPACRSSPVGAYRREPIGCSGRRAGCVLRSAAGRLTRCARSSTRSRCSGFSKKSKAAGVASTAVHVASGDHRPGISCPARAGLEHSRPSSPDIDIEHNASGRARPPSRGPESRARLLHPVALYSRIMWRLSRIGASSSTTKRRRVTSPDLAIWVPVYKKRAGLGAGPQPHRIVCRFSVYGVSVNGSAYG